MKKVLALCLIVMVSVALSTAAFAGDIMKVKGTVTKIDAAAKSVTIQPKSGDAVTVIVEDADMISKVKEGEKGEARYEVKDGKNMASKLKKVTGGCE